MLGGITWAGVLTMCWVITWAGVLTIVGWDHLGGGAYHVLGEITWAGVLTMCCGIDVLGGIAWAGVLTMCWVGSLGRGCLPCAGWDHLGGGAYHVLGGITWEGVLTTCWVGANPKKTTQKNTQKNT